MKKFIFLSILFTMALACTKYTTPRKVENRLNDGSWVITSISVGGQSMLEEFKDYSFGFGEENDMIVTGPNSFKATGTWQLGLNKNPAILYINIAPGGSLEYLADDWQVTEMSRSRMTLKSNDSGSSTTSVKMKKI